MNNELNEIFRKYKPYRYTYKNNSLIFESTQGKYVIKENKNEKLKSLYEYLEARNFYGFPKIVESRDNYILTEYIKNNSNISEQKLNDLILLMSKLHNKTSYYKEVNIDDYDAIYENLKNNAIYLDDYYNKLYDEAYLSIYPSPSNYLLLCNYTKIKSVITFVLAKIDEWHNMVKETKKQRVSVIHNDLSNKNYINKDDGYFINWDSSTIDTPVLDFVNLYKNEYQNANFEDILNTYIKQFPLLDEEKILLSILLSIPSKIEFDNNEFNNTQKITSLLDYIYKTEQLLKPYYSKEQEE